MARKHQLQPAESFEWRTYVCVHVYVCMCVCECVIFVSHSHKKTHKKNKKPATIFASSAMSINHALLAVNLVPAKIFSRVSFVNPLCLNSVHRPQRLQQFLSMKLGNEFDKWKQLWQFIQKVANMNLTEHQACVYCMNLAWICVHWGSICTTDMLICEALSGPVLSIAAYDLNTQRTQACFSMQYWHQCLNAYFWSLRICLKAFQIQESRPSSAKICRASVCAVRYSSHLSVTIEHWKCGQYNKLNL